MGDDKYRAYFLPPLRIPDGLEKMTLCNAALAYAKAGWFVLPTAPDDSKNPGSVVGHQWQKQSSRDPGRIHEWWADQPNRGIALHMERSGAVAFDLDKAELDDLPPELRDGLRKGQHQRSRTGATDRGHFVYLVGDDESFGNGTKGFGPYGDVRGKGVIIAQPTPHTKALSGGRYCWPTPGPVPKLTAPLRKCLRTASQLESPPLTSAGLRAFLNKLTGNDRPEALDGVLAWFDQQVSEDVSRHEAARDALVWAFREACAGFYPAREAYDRLETAFSGSFSGSLPNATESAGRRELPARSEFHLLAEWAAAQALLADPNETRARVNRADPGAAVVDEEAFWTSRPVLEHVRKFARSRRVSPWSMLGVVLARVVTAVPPRVVLPPQVGGVASLNLFVALVGPSGNGKGASESAASDAVAIMPEVFVTTPGSGEGIPKQYAYKNRGEQVNLREAVLFSISEIDTLAALAGRTSATLMPELRKAWMGERLGFGYATPEKAVPIMGHRYRLCLVAGVQPERARWLLNDADGGTPQRFLWFPTNDHDAPDYPPEEPAQWAWPTWPGRVGGKGADKATAGRIKFQIAELALQDPVARDSLCALGIPPEAAELIDTARLQRLRGTADNALDGHALLARLKVAAALMVLDGRTDKIVFEDWELAGTVMVISDRTRGLMQKTLGAKAHTENVQRGHAEGVRAEAAEEAKRESAIQRVAENIRKALRKENNQSRSKVRRGIAKRDHEHFGDAEERLISVGDVTKTEHLHNGQSGHKLALREGR